MIKSIDKIKQKYRASFEQKQKDIIAAWSNNDLSQLHHLLHKLAGSSGSYGYTDLSQACFDALHFIEKDSLESLVSRDKTEKIIKKVIQNLN